ncbi:hypothetical protein K503DRAFT_855054 [Rhizopogon vinicolor AM-OR11-026]|uniref:Protein CPL1-like domain-containing protein n=1 Tax=Rhizopogon vinicolor AM-OR11-026 TaxID=1314800 RepID=A0A1B7N7P8_9AGAM|nr:hypothetical protein K503DRAFT_855054 [Rhizopogon vinicolor AM-OR11-026]
MKLFLFSLILSLSVVVVSGLEARAPTPSKRYVVPNIPRQPAPSKRVVDHDSPSKRYLYERTPAPGPSARFVARDPSPSKRLDARQPVPSKRLVDRAPAPSKRLVDRAPAPSKRVAEDSAVPQKRSINEQHAMVEMDSQRGFCLDGLMACPVLSTPGQFPQTFAEWEAVGFECVDFAADLSSCGGCSSLDPVQHDCTSIPHVQGVACITGECQISSCQPGYLLQSDGQGCSPTE